METKSIFSHNTNQTGFRNTNPNNGPAIELNRLHQYYYKLLPTFSRQCPYLSKIFFLQLILRQNILIFTQDRIDARDIWLSISRMLDLKKPDLYIVGDSTQTQQLISPKNEYNRLLLFDVSKLTTELVNTMLNSQNQASLLGIQYPKSKLNPHVSDLFSIIIRYDQQQQISHLLDSYNQPAQLDSSRNFDKKLFNECVKINFQIVLKHTQEQGFIKPFLTLLQLNLEKANIKIPQNKWKKMLRLLKFIGVNKNQGIYKRLSLGDFILCPEMLSSSIQQLNLVQKVLFDVLIIFVPYYGLQKFERSTKQHFWLSNNHNQLIKKILAHVDGSSISFFYPCIKFPDTALIKIDDDRLFPYYSIQGFQKKLMSDHHYEIEPQNQYTLSLEVKSECRMAVHLGIACYDKLKNIILPVQACRKQKSQVVFQKIQGNRILVKANQNLKNWSNQQTNFAFQRAIGVYFNGDIEELIPSTQVLYNSKQPYSTTNRPFESIKIDYQNEKQGEIILSQQFRQHIVDFKHLLQKNKTIFMNHFQGGVGCIGESLLLQGKEWKKIQITYKEQQFKNSGRNFFPSSKFVRIVVMVNFNQGYPKFEIANKNGVFEFKNIKFGPTKSNQVNQAK